MGSLPVASSQAAQVRQTDRQSKAPSDARACRAARKRAKGRTIKALAIAALVPISPSVWANTVTLTTADHRLFRTDLILDKKIKVRGVIDTGSTSVVICAQMAQELSLALGTSIELETTNGTMIAHRSRLKTVQIGGIIVSDVATVVHTHETCEEVLVGLSLLAKLHKVILRGTILELVGRPPTSGK